MTISDIKSILLPYKNNISVDIPKEEDPNLADLFHKILDKDPATRIKMPQLRVFSFLPPADSLGTSMGHCGWSRSTALN